MIDDSVKHIKNNSKVHSLLLNRRHLTHNPDEEGQAGLGVLITSQKYNALDLIMRTNMSDIFLFKSENSKELKAIKEELMMDLSPKQQDEILKKAWAKKYGFLLIKGYEPTSSRYYINFDKVVFPETQNTESSIIIENEIS